MQQLEGKKKSISAFFSMDVRTLEGGVATDGGVVAELDADILISARDDIMSQVDKTGRRWVSLDCLSFLREYERYDSECTQMHTSK